MKNKTEQSKSDQENADFKRRLRAIFDGIRKLAPADQADMWRLVEMLDRELSRRLGRAGSRKGVQP